DSELGRDLRRARRAKQQLDDLPLARGERYAAPVGQDDRTPAVARPQLLEQPRYELSRHRRLAAKRTPDDVRQALGVEVLLEVTARAGTHGSHELLLVEPVRQKDHGG